MAQEQRKSNHNGNDKAEFLSLTVPGLPKEIVAPMEIFCNLTSDTFLRALLINNSALLNAKHVLSPNETIQVLLTS